MHRTTSNAKLLQRRENRKASQEAKASAARFGAKQSRFQLRQEELHVREEMLANESASKVLSEGKKTEESFSRFDRSAPAASTARFATTATATFGLAPLRRGGGKHVTESRSTRRAAKFRLADDNEQQQTHGHQTTAQEPLGAGLLGAVRRARDDDGDGSDDGAPKGKKAREERFQEVLAKSKDQRAQDQRERAQRAQQTTAIDVEFNSVMHLLERRDKVQEECEAFARVGTPEVRALLHSFQKNHQAKMVSLRGDGSFTVTPLAEKAEMEGREKVSCLDEKDMALLQRIREGVNKEESMPLMAVAEVPAGPTGRGRGSALSPQAEQRKVANTRDGDECDEFDRIMHSIRLETRKAIAGERTLTDEEQQARQEQQLLLEADRGTVPLLTHDDVQLTRSEWVSRGGDLAFQMHDEDDARKTNLEDTEDDLDISSWSDEASQQERGNEELEKEDNDELTAPVSGAVVGSLDGILTEIEMFSRNADTSRASRRARAHEYHVLLKRLYKYACEHVLQVAETFRLLLIETQRKFIRHGVVDRATLLLLHTTSRIFPMTDYRHEVTTPFLLFLCSALLQMRLKTLEQARIYATLAGLLCSSVLVGGKFCAEVIIAPLNLIALQVPRAVLEPVRFQEVSVLFPLVGNDEADCVLLQTRNDSDVVSEGEESEEPLRATFSILETDVGATRIVRYAYRLLSVLADAFHGLPAFSYCLVDPFVSLHERLLAAGAWKPCTVVRGDHDALLTKLKRLADDARELRTPLAMRSFRPRPIRQFEPLLQEGNTTTAVLKSEVREMKRELREDRKRVVRHLQAEANVERRNRERDTLALESQREKKYRDLMGSLQTQQHVMNTVDGLLNKARSKQRKRITGRADRDNTIAAGGGGSAEG